MQAGKLNMSQTLPEWSCNSGCSLPEDCRLRTCSNIAFPVAFSGSRKVRALSRPT